MRKNQCLSNLIRGPTCFKSANGSAIDLFLTTNKYLFQKTNSFETGISDHHHLIATVIKYTHREKARSNKTPALRKSTNMGVWAVGTLNQLFIRGF